MFSEVPTGLRRWPRNSSRCRNQLPLRTHDSPSPDCLDCHIFGTVPAPHIGGYSGGLSFHPSLGCLAFLALDRLCSLMFSDPFGSGIKGHNLRNVPDLPHGIRSSKRGQRSLCGTSRRVAARYGLRACRIGEAQHPGPALVTSKCLKAGSQSTRANRATSAPAGEPVTPSPSSGCDSARGHRYVAAAYRVRKLRSQPPPARCQRPPFQTRRRLGYQGQLEHIHYPCLWECNH